MNEPFRVDKIAIDGPAASGKSTLALLLAQHLNYLFFDTGVMYRAVTLAALNNHLDLFDEESLTKLAENSQIDVKPATIDDGRVFDVLIDGSDVTWEIRTPEVEKHVSQISAYSGVRRALTQQQRRIGLRGKVVMVGRDIGTVVLPEAELKIYLDASVQERARRRFDELRNRGKRADYVSILENMERRDQIDSSRDIAPLHPAEDAYIINTDGMDINDVFMRVLELLSKIE